MRICHLVYECLPGRYAGGVQKMVYEFGQAQARSGEEVEIWTVGDEAELAVEPGLRIRYFPGRRGWDSRNLRAALRTQQQRFDLIHSHNTFLPLNRIAFHAARRGARVFYHAHGALDPKLLDGFRFKSLKKRVYNHWFERPNFNAAAAVFGLTREECRQLARFGTRAPIYQLANGIWPEPAVWPAEASRFRLQLDIRPEQPVILYIGRIIHKKGLHFLIDALPAIARIIPEVVVVFCGGRGESPSYVRLLERQIAGRKVESLVRWAGFLDEQGKRGAQAAGSIFVHPSYSEGMALAILEAMSFGVPAVVTPGCYMDDAVEAGALRLARQSSDELASGILELLRDPAAARRLGEQGRRYVMEAHAWPALARRSKLIYSASPEAPRPYRARLN